MNFHTDDQHNEMSEINMTPLVDVMMVLLIIFMVTAPVITHSVKVDLPQASQQATQPEQRVVTLTVERNGDVLWNNTPITTNDLKQRLLATAQAPNPPELRIEGDKQVAYEHVVQLMAIAQQAGLQKLNFITQPK